MSAKQILLVEDDTTNRALMARFLELEGYTVASAGNGREALAYLREAEAPQLILLDLRMPVMNGWEFRREQRKSAALASIPVVIVSSEEDATSQDTTYLQKPVSCDTLLATIRRYC